MAVTVPNRPTRSDASRTWEADSAKQKRKRPGHNARASTCPSVPISVLPHRPASLRPSPLARPASLRPNPPAPAGSKEHKEGAAQQRCFPPPPASRRRRCISALWWLGSDSDGRVRGGGGCSGPCPPLVHGGWLERKVSEFGFRGSLGDGVSELAQGRETRREGGGREVESEVTTK
jgi:hypothetical protein